jgi:anti-repressor protein
MSELQVFDVEGSNMRFGTAEDGRPYVVAEDFTPQLEYSRARDALRMVDEDEKGAQIVRTPGGPQQMAVLYEDGIWELIFLSRKPRAKAIKKRVKAILREIRETGSYSADDQRKPPETYAQALRELADAEEEKEQLRAENAELKPSANAWNVLASGNGDYSVADAAKILSRDPAINVGARRLFTELATAGMIYRQQADGRWRAYQRHVDNGRLSELPQQYEHPQTGELTLGAPQLRIKPKGLRYLHGLLGGIRPLQLEEQLPIGGA